MIQSIINKKIPVLFGLLLVLFSLFSQFTSLEPIHEWRNRLELLASDARMNLFLKKEVKKDERIVIIDVDEKSLAREGRWPWSRKKISRLVDKLNQSGAIVIGFDMIFSEEERNSAVEVLGSLDLNTNNAKIVSEYLKSHQGDFDNDEIFANSLKNKDIVLGYITLTNKGKSSGKLPKPLVIENNINKETTQFLDVGSYTANLAALQNAAINGGYFTLPTTDIDGVIRRFPLISRIDNEIYSSLPLEIFRVFNLVEKIKLYENKINDRSVLTGIEIISGKLIPTDGLGQIIVPFRGKSGSYPYISASDILHNNFNVRDIENKIVLIGTTAVGLFDLRTVPVQSVYPGVEVHANIISGLLDNAFPSEPAWAPGANFAFMLLVGLVLALGLPFLNAVSQFIFAFIILTGFIAINFWLWLDKGLVLTIISPMLMVASLTAFNFLYGFFVESNGRRKLKHAFGQYIPTELVNQMDINLSQYGFEGESREMTVLFSDIVGFTGISEKLTATELKNVLNDYLTPMTEVIFEHQGTIDKYIGDLIMAFWGAPISDPQHANHAASAAMHMLQRLDELNHYFASRNLPKLSVGIGINTGEMNVGDMGSEYRRAYTVIGDSVNLASRLEGLTRYFGVDILLSENTKNQISNQFEVMKIGKVRVKGKTEAVNIYTLLGKIGHCDEKILIKRNEFENFLHQFSISNWVESSGLLSELITNHGADKLLNFYSEQVLYFKNNVPALNWQGEIQFISK